MKGPLVNDLISMCHRHGFSRRSLLTRWLLCVTLLGGLVTPLLAQAPDVEALEEEAFKAATAIADPSIVQIQTIGGLDVVGELIAGTGPTTGVVVSADGEIITSSFNFASKPSSIIVTLSDGRKFPADVVASDLVRQVTLIKIKQTGLTPLVPAPRKELQVGQWTIALGRTYDVSFPNLSVGILSALNRIWGKAVQTDAKISPANYGGPLIDLQGRCIGILVPMSPQGDDEAAGVEWYDAGIGFAVPLEEILLQLDTLRKGETIRPGRMGVMFADKGPVSGPALAGEVRPNSPAEKAGLKPGDLITQANGKPIASIPQLKTILGPLAAGSELKLIVKRDDKELPFSLTLVAELAPLEYPMLGVLPSRTVVKDAKGVTLRHVFPDSPAAKAKLTVGDAIEKLNGQDVTSPTQLTSLVEKLRVGTQTKATVRRAGGATEELSLELTALSSAVPLDLTPDLGPRAEPGKVPARTGRLDEQIPGTEGRKYWLYVPETSQPKQYGLVFWLHPEGRTGEAEQLKLWRSACEERGLILAGLLADGSWSGADGPLVKGLIEQLMAKYPIDPQRVVILGEQEGGEFGLLAALKLKDIIRAGIAIDSGLGLAPPENDVGKRQQFVILPRAGSSRLRATKNTLKNFAAKKIPTLELSAPEGDGLDEATVKQLVLWIDALDRI